MKYLELAVFLSTAACSCATANGEPVFKKVCVDVLTKKGKQIINKNGMPLQLCVTVETEQEAASPPPKTEVAKLDTKPPTKDEKPKTEQLPPAPQKQDPRRLK
jgi:hypothetical protein